MKTPSFTYIDVLNIRYQNSCTNCVMVCMFAAYARCTNDPTCARQTVVNYMNRFAQVRRPSASSLVWFFLFCIFYTIFVVVIFLRYLHRTAIATGPSIVWTTRPYTSSEVTGAVPRWAGSTRANTTRARRPCTSCRGRRCRSPPAIVVCRQSRKTPT